MDVKEFAKYTIDNMGRATLANALTIANKLDNPNFYSLQEYMQYMYEYICILEVNKNLGFVLVAKIIVAIDKCYKAYNSEFKYNKEMIIDNFIIDIWKAFMEK